MDVIYNTLRETGLLWDEGPDIGGPVGPYVPVSYTHLDVYKRQVWGLVVITGGNLNVLNDTVMHSSLYYKAFNMFNPFL